MASCEFVVVQIVLFKNRAKDIQMYGYVKCRLDTIGILNAHMLGYMENNLRVYLKPQIFRNGLLCNLLCAPQLRFVLSEVAHSCAFEARLVSRKWHDLFSDIQKMTAFQI